MYQKDLCNQEGYEWHKEKIEEDITFNINLTNENYELNEVLVLIEIESTYPYKKKLKGNFHLTKVDQDLEDIMININNKTSSDEIHIINTFNEDKCYGLLWDKNNIKINEDLGNFIHYEEDPTGFINEVHFKINKKSSKIYNFINLNDTLPIKEEDFTLIELNTCL